MARRILMTVLLSGVTTFAYAENWVLQTSTPQVNIFVDTDSFARSEEGFSEREKLAFPAPVSRKSGGDPIVYGIANIDWNCIDRSMRTTHVAMYTAKNDVVAEGNVQRRTDIQPGTWTDNLLALQCPKTK